MNKLSLKAQ